MLVSARFILGGRGGSKILHASTPQAVLMAKQRGDGTGGSTSTININMRAMCCGAETLLFSPRIVECVVSCACAVPVHTPSYCTHFMRHHLFSANTCATHTPDLTRTPIQLANRTDGAKSSTNHSHVSSQQAAALLCYAHTHPVGKSHRWRCPASRPQGHIYTFAESRNKPPPRGDEREQVLYSKRSATAAPST